MTFFIFISLVLVPIIYFASILIYALATDYKPPLKESLSVENQPNEHAVVSDSSEFSILIWNIGYAGLGAKEDFFYDGGKKTRAERGDYEEYKNSILKFLENQKATDFIMIQEVDIDSKRTFRDNQMSLLSSVLDHHYYSFARNYDVKFVPVPIFKPLGKVDAGMATFSRFKPHKVERIGFDVNFVWWKRIFMLDRCFIASHYKIGDKKLLMINIHNSAFDDDNILKPVELQTIKDYALAAYQEGAYVIMGGDWNQNPPNFKPSDYPSEWNVIAFDEEMPEDLMGNDWQWVYAKDKPTQRFLNEVFTKGKTTTSLLDYFLVSPNVEVLEINILPDNFENSDHMPVLMRFR